MQIIADRRALHRIPEVGLHLPKTMSYLKEALAECNCKVFSPMESSLCAFFDFGREDAIAFRSDCDALPVAEKTGASYASCHDGNMHACGHDGHMAILLEFARRLSAKKELSHNVLLVFQPGEESPGGAEPLCNTGVLEAYRVKTLFGLHLWPGVEAGVFYSRIHEVMARSCELTVDVYGKSAHIARAIEGVDAVDAAVEFYSRAMKVERALPDSVFRVLKFGKFHSGTARNALSAHTHMEGTLRSFDDDVFNNLRSELYRIAGELEQEMGCRVEIHFNTGYPAVINPQPLAEKVMQIFPYRLLEQPYMIAEDFSFYQKRVDAMFFFLGLGDAPALHATNFDFDETILLKGADFFEKLAEEFQ